MARQGGQLGVPILRSLAEEWTVSILSELGAGPLRPCELEERLPGTPHAAITRRLCKLLSRGVVVRKRSTGLSPRAYYALSEGGRALVEISDAAERWARNWSTPESGGRPAGRLALRLSADERTRSILLSLAGGPLRPVELDVQLPQIGRSAARERLSQLDAAGILTRVDLAGHRHYALTPGARRLSLIGMLAARWEWKWAGEWTGGWDGEWDGEASSGDLPGLLRLLAPIVRPPEPVAGVCRLRFASDPFGQEIYLVAAHGRLAALQASSAPPEATAWAPPQIWCDALLHEHLEGIGISGNATLMATILASVTSALLS